MSELANELIEKKNILIDFKIEIGLAVKMIKEVHRLLIIYINVIVNID